MGSFGSYKQVPSGKQVKDRILWGGKEKEQFFTYLSNFEKRKEAIFQQRRTLFIWKMLTRCSQKVRHGENE